MRHTQRTDAADAAAPAAVSHPIASGASCYVKAHGICELPPPTPSSSSSSSSPSPCAIPHPSGGAPGCLTAKPSDEMILISVDVERNSPTSHRSVLVLGDKTAQHNTPQAVFFSRLSNKLES